MRLIRGCWWWRKKAGNESRLEKAPDLQKTLDSSDSGVEVQEEAPDSETGNNEGPEQATDLEKTLAALRSTMGMLKGNVHVDRRQEQRSA